MKETVSYMLADVAKLKDIAIKNYMYEVAAQLRDIEMRLIADLEEIEKRKKNG